MSHAGQLLVCELAEEALPSVDALHQCCILPACVCALPVLAACGVLKGTTGEPARCVFSASLLAVGLVGCASAGPPGAPGPRGHCQAVCSLCSGMCTCVALSVRLHRHVSQTGTLQDLWPFRLELTGVLLTAVTHPLWPSLEAADAAVDPLIDARTGVLWPLRPLHGLWTTR